MGSEKRSPSDEREKNFELASRLFREYEDFIRSVIRFALWDPAEEDDLFQDLYISFALNPPSKELRNPRAFLYRMILDRARDRHRRHYRRQQTLQQLEFLTRSEDTQPGAEAILSQSEEVGALFIQIQAYLKENHAQAILYRFKENHTLKETAEKMGLKPKTVSRYVWLGLKKIRKILNNK